jgi:adenine-specific DNA methylase
MIEKVFDIAFIGELALREKQVQQNYRPIIAVHKWFARRPGTLFRGLLLSEFVDSPLRDSFFRPHHLNGISVADPFMGGGTPLIEANRVGCDVTGYDINPMAYWIVRQELEHIDIEAYRAAGYDLIAWLRERIAPYYQTTCTICSSAHAEVKYFLWVKQFECLVCQKSFDLFPGYLLAENKRHPKNVLICPQCGELNEVEDRKTPGYCALCHTQLTLKGTASRNRCTCPHCGTVNTYPNSSKGTPRHRMVAIEDNATLFL